MSLLLVLSFEKLGSRRQTLATLCPARRQNPTARCSRHSRAETMPAFADEFARLVGAFHDRKSDNGISVERIALYSGAA